MWTRFCATAVVAVWISAPIVAMQVPNIPAPRLVNAKAIRCSFSVLATGTWKDGIAEAATKPANVSVAFSSIDTEDGTADAVDDTRKSHITVRVLGNYMNFMQVDAYGALYVTTVFNTETKGGRLLAVHTRHEYTPVQLPGLTSRPEQYYGDCDVK
ncbi:MAG TPA: hypothetical protein VMO26_09595 [Vicinamibacterales bacterium]|nr:hypothetical protein [Vicinamibacterales bacterium]